MRFRALIVAFLAICLGVLTVNTDALAVAPSNLTYEEVKGTGIANTCPQLDDSATGSIAVTSDNLLVDLCIEPTKFYVKEEPKNRRNEPEFVEAKLMTRETTTLEAIQGPLTLTNGGITFTEKDGIDFQAATVKTRKGELVAMLFTVKQLVANASGNTIDSSTVFNGNYTVPSYRTSAFLDPKGRGISAGYDTAVALPGSSDAEQLERANKKRFEVSEGEITLSVDKVDAETGEIAGTFVSEQFSDSDLGAEDPEEVKIEGIFYARVEADLG